METYGFAQHFNAIDFTIGRLPIILFTLLWAFFYAPKVTPEKPILPIIGNSQKATDEPPLTKVQDMAGSLIFILTILALIFNAQLGVPAYSDPRLATQIVGLIGKEKINQAKTRIQSR